jgi:hypothetical protein
MDTDTATRDAEAARLLEALADTADDEPLLESYRREAAAFDPNEAAVDLVLDLLSRDVDPEGLDESLATLESLLAKLGQARALQPELRLLDGLARLEAAEPDFESPRARKLRETLLKGLRAASRSAL